ncbi:hypothetical protein E3N88_15357 [Mikania micrantha]|uniref:Uncharacterized protein n=1 Tax=Mikania micrantha TaxID=192012 RepID=A0A5N6NWK3_9ASTR|nr:hypothetical protein E3N88_15357 [Mikania micrantha]
MRLSVGLRKVVRPCMGADACPVPEGHRNGRKPDGAMPRGAAVIQRMQALSGMIGRKASVGGFLSPPSNPRAQLWTGGGNYQAGVRGANGIRYPSSPSRKRWILGGVRIDPCSAVANALSIPPGELDMPRILLKEMGAFGNADTGGAWLSSARATASDKPEEGEDDVKSSCPLCPGRHTCYNGRDKGSRSREGELTPKTRPQFGLQAATRLHEAGIASGILNALATALHGSIRTSPSIHRLRLGLLGYLIPFAPLAFVSQCQCRPSRVLSPLVFFPISTHFTAPPEIPSAPTVLQLDALRPIIPDNACILCITAAAGTELADAYSPDTVIASSPGKEVHDPWAFYLHAALLRQAFAHCGKFPTAASFGCIVLIAMDKSSFKLEHPLERRQAEAARIREKYPDRIPVIVEKTERSDMPDIDKKKYLVPADLTVGQFVYVVRKRIKLTAEKAIFIFVKNILPPTAAMMSAIYEENKDEDGFLYMTYCGLDFGSMVRILAFEWDPLPTSLTKEAGNLSLAIDSIMERLDLLERSDSFNDPTMRMSQAKNEGKQIGHEEKMAAVHEEIKKVNQLPAHSTYATHRMRVLNKILQLLSVQVWMQLLLLVNQ